jgi:hypothetical protein
MLHTSMALIRAAGSCPEGIERTRLRLLELHSGDEDSLFPVAAILGRSDLDDAVWALSAVPAWEFRERDRVALTFAVECVAHAGSTVTNPPEADYIRRVLRMACLRVGGRLRPDRSSRLWRALRRKSAGSYIARAARATLFPGCVSEAARHAAVCSIRASALTGGGAEEERLWQVACLRRLLTPMGSEGPPKPALQLTRRVGAVGGNA